MDDCPLARFFTSFVMGRRSSMIRCFGVSRRAAGRPGTRRGDLAARAEGQRRAGPRPAPSWAVVGGGPLL